MRGVGGFALAATVCIASGGAAAGGAVFALGLRQLPRQSHVKTEELLFPSRQTPPRSCFVRSSVCCNAEW